MLTKHNKIISKISLLLLPFFDQIFIIFDERSYLPCSFHFFFCISENSFISFKLLLLFTCMSLTYASILRTSNFSLKLLLYPLFPTIEGWGLISLCQANAHIHTHTWKSGVHINIQFPSSHLSNKVISWFRLVWNSMFIFTELH